MAVYYNETEYTGTFTAFGGSGLHGWGGAGTVYVQNNGKNTLTVDNQHPHPIKKVR